jgi:hypothetical protein
MTATNTTVFSYGLVIRDMLLGKLMIAPFFAGFTFRLSRQLPTQVNQLPSLGVYLVKEDMTPDGDPNHGDIDMVHALTVGFSVIIINNDPEATQEKLNQAYWLWRDPYMMSMFDTHDYHHGGIGNPDDVRIEGLLNGNWRFYDHAPFNNETPLSELRYEQTLRYRADYTPVITDDLLQISLKTGVKHDDTPLQMSQRLQVAAEYVFEPATTKGTADGRANREASREPAHEDS